MTLSELSQLPNEELRVMVAEKCGWKRYCVGSLHWYHEKLDPEETLNGLLPNYPADLNAMHEAEKLLKEDECDKYLDYLTEVCYTDSLGRASYLCYFATARQRCIAFLATI